MILVESLNFGRRWDGRVLAEVQRSKLLVKVGCTGPADCEAPVLSMSHASSHLLPLKYLCRAVTLLSGMKYHSLSSWLCCVPTAITAVKYLYDRAASEFAAELCCYCGKRYCCLSMQRPKVKIWQQTRTQPQNFPGGAADGWGLPACQ